MRYFEIKMMDNHGRPLTTRVSENLLVRQDGQDYMQWSPHVLRPVEILGEVTDEMIPMGRTLGNWGNNE